jgi:single-strand DNA-binding protein
MIKLILIGNVGPDPELRYAPNGQPLCSFSVATNYRYKTSSGEQREETEWSACQAWGKLAETCNQYLHKGSQVYLEGRLKSRTYQTQGGETRFSNDVMVSQFQFLGKRDGQSNQGDDSGVDDVDDPPW